MRLKQLILVLQIATVAVFLGRGWQHLLFGAPYRAVLWDQAWMGWWIENRLGWDWGEYVSSETVDQNITLLTAVIGWFYIGFAIATATIQRIPTLFRIVLLIGAVGLVLLAGLYSKERFFQLGQFLEYTLQCTTPIFLYSILRYRSISNSLIFWMKVTAAVTFVCHGLYAIGYYPRPGNFVEMVLNILPITEAQAVQFLKWAGMLDFVAAFMLFLPRSISVIAASYMIFWGFMTTIARLLAYVDFTFWQETLLRWLPETLIRLPHFLIPFVILVYLLQQKEISIAD